MFGPVSGGHFNPVVSFVDASFGGLSWRDARAYSLAQIAGCILGALAANTMFAHALVSISTKHRASACAPLLGGDRDARADARDLLARPHQARRHGSGGRRCLYRRGLLLHQLGKLREPGDQHRPDVLEHLRRHRAGRGPGIRNRATRRRRRRGRRDQVPLPGYDTGDGGRGQCYHTRAQPEGR